MTAKAASTVTALHQLEQFDPKFHDWESWRIRFKVYLLRQNDLKDAQKTYELILSLSPAVFDVLRRICQPEEVEEKKCDDLLALLDEHYGKEHIPMAAQYRLFTAHQAAGQTVTEFAEHIRELGAAVTFPIELDEALATAFVIGLQNDRQRCKLLAKKEVTTLEQALEIVKLDEQAASDSSAAAHSALSQHLSESSTSHHNKHLEEIGFIY